MKKDEEPGFYIVRTANPLKDAEKPPRYKPEPETKTLKARLLR
jgi:hypothetical protein